MDCSEGQEIAGYRAAEAVLALINASPRTPGVLELAEAIVEFMPLPASVGEPCCADFEACTRACYHRGYAACQKAHGEARRHFSHALDRR